IDIILQLPKDMLCLHSKDIVHNDLKLDNVLKVRTMCMQVQRHKSIYQKVTHTFSMVYYKILIKKFLLKKLNLNKTKKKIMSGDYPPLLNHCPSLLEILIEDCWKFNLKYCPMFLEIFKVFRNTKYLFMTS
uniref:Protein kinase domain-containing protein n=1 Tax=Physcomitrium patens TaxID=3218 RepID=A0A7I4AQC7_PHYPA